MARSRPWWALEPAEQRHRFRKAIRRVELGQLLGVAVEAQQGQAPERFVDLEVQSSSTTSRGIQCRRRECYSASHSDAREYLGHQSLD